jgi:hypothetical protein
MAKDDEDCTLQVGLHWEDWQWSHSKKGSAIEKVSSGAAVLSVPGWQRKSWPERQFASLLAKWLERRLERGLEEGL